MAEERLGAKLQAAAIAAAATSEGGALSLVLAEYYAVACKYGDPRYRDKVDTGLAGSRAVRALGAFIEDEGRRRQLENPKAWVGVFLEEVGEALRVVNAAPDKVELEALAEELVQVAAVATAWVDHIRQRLEAM
ncbi:MAG: hypothetical protein ACPGVG_18195 [Mycobacterium sp.]